MALRRLDRHHRLVDGRRGGIGRRRQRRDDAHWLGVFDDAPGFVFLDDADRFGSEQIAQRAERLALVLDDLVGHVAEPGIGNGERGKFARVLGLVDRPGQRANRLVGAFLADVAETFEGDARAPHDFVNDRLMVRIHRRFHCHSHRHPFTARPAARACPRAECPPRAPVSSWRRGGMARQAPD